MKTNKLVWTIALVGAALFACTDESAKATAEDDNESQSQVNPENDGDPGNADVDNDGSEDDGNSGNADADNDDPEPEPDAENPSGQIVDTIDDGTDSTDDNDSDESSGGYSEGEDDKQCDDICEAGTHQCVDGGSVECVYIDGCPNWGAIAQCAKCNAETGLCVSDCQDECTLDALVCDGNEIKKCQKSSSGCTQWAVTQTCQANQKCDDAKHTCVEGCKDQCKENEVQCDSTKLGVRKCVKNEAGCLVWKDSEKCAANKMCDTKTNKCVLACGDEKSDTCKPFSIILLPDTQYYTESVALGKIDHNKKKIANGNSLFERQAEWIAKKQKDKNIKMVIGLGDMTNRNRANAWKNAQIGFKKIAKASIPFVVSTGNHDYYYGKDNDKNLKTEVILPSRSKTKFANYFNKSIYKEFYIGTSLSNVDSWFSDYSYGANSYATFSVGNIHFLVFDLEYYPRKDVIQWADGVLNNKKYADYHVIVATHGYLSRNGYSGQAKRAMKVEQAHGISGKELFNEFIRRHSNIDIVVGGHVSGAKYSVRQNLFMNNVHEVLVDYQSETPISGQQSKAECGAEIHVNMGAGWLRELSIDPKTGKVSQVTHTVIPSNEFKAFYGTNTPIMKCTKYYKSDYTKGEHTANTYNNYTFQLNLSPAAHQYSDKDYFDFVPRNINSQGRGSQLSPRIAVNRETGDFVAVWEDNSDDQGTHNETSNGKTVSKPNYDIALRMFKHNGYRLSSPNNIQRFVSKDNKTSKGHQVTPDIAMDKSGNYVIVWADDTDTNGSYDIRMTGFKADGTIRFSNQLVSAKTAGNQTKPRISMAPDGRFVVAWNDKQSGDKTYNVKLRTFKADGKPASDEKYLVDKTAGTRRNPDVAMDANANYVVVWDDDNDGNGSYQIYAHKYDFNGKRLGNVSPVNTDNTGQQISASVGINEKGAFFIAWRDDREKTGKYKIHVRGWDENLKEIIKDTALYGQSHNNSWTSVCVDGNNNAAIAFYDPSVTNIVKSQDVYYKDDKSGDVLISTIINGKVSSKQLDVIVDMVGTTKSKTIKAVSPATMIWNNQKMPWVECTKDGHVVAVFADDADANGAYEIYGRGYSDIKSIIK